MEYNQENDDNIELNNNGLDYNEVESIFKIRNFLKMEIFQEEIYRVNRIFIVIKDNEIKENNNIDMLDTSMMHDTLVMKQHFYEEVVVAEENIVTPA